jgi:uncharacterized protein (DUF1697 family)
MPAYIAMLRGVNVGGNPLKMDWLRKTCEELGLRGAQTYLQSGSLVFSSSLTASKVAALLAARIDAHTVRPVPVLVRTASEMSIVVTGNPFLGRKGVAADKLHVTFLGKAPATANTGKLDQLAGQRDQYHLAGKELYLHCPINYGESKLSNAAVEKALGVTATTRNWKTVQALLALAEG